MATDQATITDFASLVGEEVKAPVSDQLEGRKLTELARNGKGFTVRSARKGPYRYFGEALHCGIELEGAHYGLSVPIVDDTRELYEATIGAVQKGPLKGVRLVKRRLPGAGFFLALAPAKK